MMKLTVLLVTHAITLVVGFALGIYLLPILTAPDAPSADEVRALAVEAQYVGRFKRDLRGSDLLHWGEGDISVSRSAVTLAGRIAPGPAYKLYLTPQLVETEAEFLAIKGDSAQVGDVKTFENFVVRLPSSVDIDQYRAVLVWCESFSEFITAAAYR